MTTDEQRFLQELEIFRGECEAASQHLYAHLTIRRLASRRKSVLRALNRHALFWNTAMGALQQSALITLGRAFDQDTPHNVDVLLRLASRVPSIFSRASLAARKAEAGLERPWAEKFAAGAYEPTPTDFRTLRTHIKKARRIYERRYRDLRNRVYAHTVATGDAEVRPLAAQAHIGELKRLIVSLLSVHDTLWQLFWNGRAPVVRKARYSAKPRGTISMQDPPRDRIVVEVEAILSQAARANMRCRRRGTLG
jgi:hypothetical protein